MDQGEPIVETRQGWRGRRTGVMWRAGGHILAGGIVMFCAVSCAAEQERDAARGDGDVAVGRSGMVASDSPFASEAGLKILKDGGNAVDAAVATSLALSVTRPYSAGVGGGGFMMVRLAETGEVHLLDYREMAPAAATRDMYLRARERAPDAAPPSVYGALAVGVPGHLRGHAAMVERFGTRTWAELVEPAVRLAEEGFPVDDHYLGAVRSTRRTIQRYPDLESVSAFVFRRLLFEGADVEAGAILRQPEKAGMLRRVGEEGPEVFYQGDMAEAIVETINAHGGILTVEDLAAYRPVWREPIRVSYRDRYEVLLMPPPSSGGVCIAQALNILEHWDLRAVQRRDAGLAAHLLVEALKHAFADRARHLGDADFVDVPLAQLTSKAYGRELAGRISEDAVAPQERYGVVLEDDGGTTHFCVTDRWGNVVSATETINTGFGSLVGVASLGVVLNNEMDDFSAEPGKVNIFGLRQSEKNAVEPGKRPLSSMSPTIVLERGEPVLAVGASGGPRIITATLQVMLDIIEFDRTLDEAIRRPRLHHQWEPALVYRNAWPDDDPVVEGLRRRGHTISGQTRGAVVQAIVMDGERMIGASDPRKGGRPAGY